MTIWELYAVFREAHESFASKEKREKYVSSYSKNKRTIKLAVNELSTYAGKYSVADILSEPYQKALLSFAGEKMYNAQTKAATLLTALTTNYFSGNSRQSFDDIATVLFYLKEIALMLNYLLLTETQDSESLIIQINRAMSLDAMDGKYMYSDQLRELISNINDKAFLSYIKWADDVIWAIAMLNYKTHNYRQSIFFFECYLSRIQNPPICDKKRGMASSACMRAKLYIGYSYEKNEEFDTAISAFEAIDNELPENDSLRLEVYHGLGHFYNERAVFDKRERTDQEKSADIASARFYMLKALNQKADYSSCFGSLFHEYGDYNMAADIFEYASSKEDIRNDPELSSEMKFYIAQTLMVLATEDDKARRKRAEKAFTDFEKYCKDTYNYDGIVHARVFRAKLIMRKFSLFPHNTAKPGDLDWQRNEIAKLIRELEEYSLSVYASASIQKEYDKVINSLYVFMQFTVGHSKELNYTEIQHHLRKFYKEIISQEQKLLNANNIKDTSSLFSVEVNGVQLLGIGEYSRIKAHNIFKVDSFEEERFNVNELCENLNIDKFIEFLRGNSRPDIILLIIPYDKRSEFEKGDLFKSIDQDDTIYIVLSETDEDEKWLVNAYRQQTGRNLTVGQKYFVVKGIEDLLRLGFCFRCFGALKKDILSPMPLFSLAPTHFSESYNYQLGEALELLDSKRFENRTNVKQATLRTALERQNKKYDNIYDASKSYKLQTEFLKDKHCAHENLLFACCFVGEDIQAIDIASKTISFVIKDAEFLLRHGLDKLFVLDKYYGYKALYNYVDELNKLDAAMGYDSKCENGCNGDPCCGCCEGGVEDNDNVSQCVNALLAGVFGPGLNRFNYRYRVIRKSPSPDSNFYLFLKNPGVMVNDNIGLNEAKEKGLDGAAADHLDDEIAQSNDETKTMDKPDLLLNVDSNSDKPQKRFKISLSFSGEYRKSVIEPIAVGLLKDFTKEELLYDRFHEAEFAMPGLDLVLQDLYRCNSDLVVVFLCEGYDKKPWAGLEWSSIRVLRNHETEKYRVMFIKLGDGEVAGFSGTVDGCIDAKDHTKEGLINLIKERYQLTVKRFALS